MDALDQVCSRAQHQDGLSKEIHKRLDKADCQNTLGTLMLKLSSLSSLGISCAGLVFKEVPVLPPSSDNFLLIHLYSDLLGQKASRRGLRHC